MTVIGNKDIVIGKFTDEEGINTLAGRTFEIKTHLHSACNVYPTLANGIEVAAVNDASTWTLGTITQVVPINTIALPFDIHYLLIENASADTTYCIVFYYGPDDTECGRTRFTKDSIGQLAVTSSVPFITPLIPANSRIRARLATPGNNGETVTLSVFYHTY